MRNWWEIGGDDRYLALFLPTYWFGPWQRRFHFHCSPQVAAALEESVRQGTCPRGKVHSLRSWREWTFPVRTWRLSPLLTNDCVCTSGTNAFNPFVEVGRRCHLMACARQCRLVLLMLWSAQASSIKATSRASCPAAPYWKVVSRGQQSAANVSVVCDTHFQHKTVRRAPEPAEPSGSHLGAAVVFVVLQTRIILILPLVQSGEDGKLGNWESWKDTDQELGSRAIPRRPLVH